MALAQNAHDVGLFHDEEILALDFDLGAGPLAEQDAVALFDVEFDYFPALFTRAGTDGNDLTFLGLFFMSLT